MDFNFLFDEIEPTEFELISMALVFITEHSETLCFALSVRKSSFPSFARYLIYFYLGTTVTRNDLNRAVIINSSASSPKIAFIFERAW